MLDRSKNKLKTQDEIDCDTNRLYGTIDEAIDYLKEMKRLHGATISLDEKWYGYEDMSLMFVIPRDETDEEYKNRWDKIRYSDEYEKQKRESDAAKEKRRVQYQKLRAEFG